MQAGLDAFRRRCPGRWTMPTLKIMPVMGMGPVVLDGWWGWVVEIGGGGWLEVDGWMGG